MSIFLKKIINKSKTLFGLGVGQGITILIFNYIWNLIIQKYTGCLIENNKV